MLGSADPSGAINMVRVRAAKGIWSSPPRWAPGTTRTEIDAGGPINAAGTVRGRLVTAYQDRHYFCSTKSKTPLFYGVIDADLGQDTTLTFGARHQATNTDGYWLFGLPRYKDGGALDVSRSTSLIQDWNRQKGQVNSLRRSRAPLQQGLEGAPVAQPHRGRPGPARGHPGGRRGPDHGQGSSFSTLYFNNAHVKSDGLDLNTTGSFQALGGTHQVLLGASWSRQRIHQKSVSLDANTAIDIYNPDHASIPRPTRPDWDSKKPRAWSRPACTAARGCNWRTRCTCCWAASSAG